MITILVKPTLAGSTRLGLGLVTNEKRSRKQKSMKIDKASFPTRFSFLQDKRSLLTYDW